MKNYNSGFFTKHKFHQSFTPSFINHNNLRIEDPSLILLIGQARAALAKLDMFSLHISNIELFIIMHTLKEATQSSKIEGTQTNIIEAVLPEANINDDRKDDWIEVQNYTRAMNEAQELLKKYPLSNRVIKKLHQTLLSGARGKRKTPGEFRRSQNWIGGSSISDATFVPPINDELPELLADLEQFIHNEEIALDPLIKAAIIHYQFETIHPFLDGNGRVGRLIIPLYLQSQNLITKPILYMSQFFEKHRALYYDKLMAVRISSDITNWVKFFLNGIIDTATIGVNALNQVVNLEKRNYEQIAGLTQYNDLKKLLANIYSSGGININTAMSLLNTSGSTARRRIKQLEELSILEKVTPNFYLHSDYLNIFEEL